MFDQVVVCMISPHIWAEYTELNSDPACIQTDCSTVAETQPPPLQTTELVQFGWCSVSDKPSNWTSGLKASYVISIQM